MAQFNVPCTTIHCLKVDEHCWSTKLTLNHVKFNHIFIISFNTDVRKCYNREFAHNITHIYQNAKNDALDRLNLSQVTTSCFSSSTFFFSSVVSSPVFWCVIRSSSCMVKNCFLGLKKQGQITAVSSKYWYMIFIFITYPFVGLKQTISMTSSQSAY